ncbi:MAG: protein-glutamate O-methyltransferase CheR [Planctomycetes bacterium]|nr:protein-glutamate O-methyltransferase CheR [Planctomycetota bacterium]
MTITDQDYEFLRTVMKEDSAMLLEPSKAYLVEARLGPVARANGHASVGALLQALRASPNGEVRRSVVEAMTINETSFLRDRHPFDALCGSIVPELLETRAKKRALNLWSGACSTGQEPYSIAMLLRDTFPQLQQWNVSIWATDISENILEKARAASYSQIEVNRGLPEDMLRRYFAQDGNRWRLGSEIKDMVQFRQLNLAGRWPLLPSMDVILLRNVLIYFDVPTKRQILEGMARKLEPDGFLILGASETTLGITEVFERVAKGQTTVYRPRVRVGK